MAASSCPGCGLALAEHEGPTHAYLGASPACWALYGELLAREFSNPMLFKAVHPLTVDAYAVQHPGRPERRSIQSVGLHLCTLCLVVDHDADPAEGPKLHRRLMRNRKFVWLDPPTPNGTITVATVLASDDHHAAVWAWARDVWAAWRPHHETVQNWLTTRGGTVGFVR